MGFESPAPRRHEWSIIDSHASQLEIEKDVESWSFICSPSKKNHLDLTAGDLNSTSFILVSAELFLSYFRIDVDV